MGTVCIAAVLIVLHCIGEIQAFNNVIDKYELYKGKRIETKLDELSTNVKLLTAEITSLKKINKKLFKSIDLKNIIKDAPRKEDRSRKNLDKDLVLTSPLQSSHLTKQCPSSFELSTHSSCYHIESEKVTWAEAKTMCMTIGADLVSVETQSEQNYIVEHLKNSKIYRHCDVWTSGTDSRHEGTWKWDTAYMQQPLSYTHWQRDEPNNGGGDEHCLWMDWFYGWSWNDAKCDLDTACFICERKITFRND